jgi:transposase-like protein
MRYPTLRQTLAKFANDEACLAHLGRIRWPDGPCCPKCTTATGVSRFQSAGKTGKVRRLYQCQVCRSQFSATAGTLFHDSHLPLTDWFLVIYLMDSSKMRISAKGVERMLGVSYETAWNMHHRIGQAMGEEDQKAFLQKLIGVIGVQEPKVGGHGRV